MGKAGFIKHTDVENWFVKSTERRTVLWVSLKMTSISHELHLFGPNSQFAHEDYSRTLKDSVKN